MPITRLRQSPLLCRRLVGGPGDCPGGKDGMGQSYQALCITHADLAPPAGFETAAAPAPPDAAPGAASGLILPPTL